MNKLLRSILPLIIFNGCLLAQNTAAPFIKPQFFYNNNGEPLNGGKLCTYNAGLGTFLTTYQDSSLGTPNTNPVILDSAGRANIFLTASSYKLVLREPGSDTTCNNGTILWTVDNVTRAVNLASLPLGTANQILGMNSGATSQEHKTLAVGSSGTDFAIAHSAGLITFNLPSASSANRGVVTIGSQSFTGAKTFLTSPIVLGATTNLSQWSHAGMLFEGATTDGFETTIDIVDPTADRTFTVPNADSTTVTGGTQTFAGAKTFSSTTTSLRFLNSTIVTFADLDATPTVGGSNIFKTANTMATTITALDDCAAGQQVQIIFTDTNTTLSDAGTLKLSAGFTSTASDTMTLICDGTNAYEIARSVN